MPLMPREPGSSENDSRIMVRMGVRLSLILNSSIREGERLTERFERGGARLCPDDDMEGGVGDEDMADRFDEGPIGGSVADAERCCCCREDREYLDAKKIRLKKPSSKYLRK